MTKLGRGRVGWGLLVGGLLLLSTLPTAGQVSPMSVAFPIQRVAVIPAELPGLMKRLDTGTLTRLPSQEFDALLATARLHADRKRSQPTVAEVRYRAKLLTDRLDENSLTGTAEWKIRRHPEQTSTLSLLGLQLAIRQAKWPDGQEASLYARPGTGVFLEVPTLNNTTLNLEWSLRGISELGELRFSLNVVPAALAVLDLELPATLTPFLLDEDALLSGPTPADNGFNVWRISFGGIARLELVLRRSDAPLPLLFGRLNTTIRLADLDGTARFEYRLDGASGGFTELQFDHEASVTPIGVTVNNLVAWSSETLGEGRKRLHVRLREPTRSASLVITAAVSIPKPPATWTSPTLLCRNSVLRSEQLHWITTERTDLLQWNANGYRVVNAERLADGTYTIDYEPLPQADAKVIAPKPTAVVQRRAPVDSRAAQQGSWTITPQEEVVQVNTRWTLRDGRLTTATFRLPERWTLERVDSGGRDLPYDLGPNQLLQVTLPRTIVARETLEVNVRLKRPMVALAERETRPVPDVIPLGVSSRQGRLIVKVDPTWRAIWTGAAGEMLQFTDAKQELDITYDSEGPSGRVRWETRSSRTQVEVHTDLMSSRIQARLQVRVPRGTISEQPPLVLWTPSPVIEPWGWRDPAGRFVVDAQRIPAKDIATRLLGFAATANWASLPTLASSANGGYHWLLPLPKIPATELELETDYVGATKLPPLIWVPQADFVGYVTDDSTSIQQYGRATKKTKANATAVRATVAPATLTHTLSDDGQVHTRFCVRIRGWSAPTLPLQLPPQTTVRSVRIAGHVVPLEPSATLMLPLPSSSSWLDIEVDYRHSVTAFQRLPTDVPTLPLPLPSALHTWRMSPKWLPLAHAGWHTHSAPTPPLPLPDGRALLEPLRALLTGEHVQTLTVASREELLATVRRDYRQQSLIVDERALAATDPAQPLTVVALELRQYVVLTTPKEYRSWQAQAPLENAFIPSIERALAEARQHGRDAAARFVLLSEGDSPPAFTPYSEVPSDWVLLEQRDPVVSPLLVDRSLVHIGTWLLALLPVGLVTRCRHTRRRSFLLCGWLVLWGGIWLRGPEPWPAFAVLPLLSGLVAGALQAWVIRHPTPAAGGLSGRTTISLRPAVGMIAALIVVATVRAAEPATLVYVLAGPTPQVSETLAPTAFVERLRQAAALAQERPNVVLTRANYQGTVEGNHARFKAEFRVVVYDHQPTRITLPLGQVKLGEVLLDGGPANTVEVKDSELSIAVRGRGTHTLQLQFVIPVTTTNGRELRFSIPEIPNTHLRFEARQPVSRLRVVGWRGAVQVTSTPQHEVLDVDLGNAASIHLLWQPSEKENAPTYRVREVALWSLSSMQTLLRSAIEYRIDSGSLGELKVLVPGDCDLLSLDLRRETVGPTANNIRAWSLTPSGGATRLLTVQLHAPLNSRAVLQLELVPTARLPVRPTLRVPAVANVEAESYVALAVDPNLTMTDLVVTPLTPLDAAAFTANTWTPLWGQTTEPLTAAYRITGKESTKLTGTLRMPPSVQSVAHHVEWGIETNRVLGTVTSRWTATEKLVTFDWPLPNGYTLIDLRAPGLQRWTQSGNRVRVWLDKPMPDVVVTWRVLRPLTLNDGVDLDLPTPTSSSPSTCTAKVVAASGLVFFTNPAEPHTELTWSPKTNEGQRLRVLPSTLPEATSESTIDAQRDGLVCQQRVQLQRLATTRPQALFVRLAHGTPSDVALAVPQGWTAKVKGAGPQRGWELTIPAGPRADDYLRITTRLPFGTADRWTVPTCEIFAGVRRVPFRAATVTLATKDLVLDSADGLETLAPNYLLAVSQDWHVTLMRSGANIPPKYVEAGNISVTPIARTWYYRARYRLNIAPSRELRLVLPEQLQSVWVNQEPLSPAATLTLDSTATTLEVVWQAAEFRSQRPVFLVAGEVWEPPTTWDIIAPPGMVLENVEYRTTLPVDLPTPNMTGPEWSRGLPYRLRGVTYDGPPNPLTVAVPSFTLSQWVFVGAGFLFVLLNLGSHVRFAPEQLICVGLGVLACCGTMGLLGVIFLVVGIGWRVQTFFGAQPTAPRKVHAAGGS